VHIEQTYARQRYEEHGYGQWGWGTVAGEELLILDDLAAHGTALVVLQAEPVDRGPQPLGRQSEGTCALAAELTASGAGAVLVVPPLPDALAAKVVSAR
jgi:hypothetical protein